MTASVSPGSPNLDEQKVCEVFDAWAAATSAGDLTALLNLMTDDVTFLIPARPPMRREEFASVFRSMSDAFTIETRSDVQEITVSGDLAVCWNVLEVKITPAAGGTTTKRAGNTLTAFRRGKDGQWRVWRDANLLATI